MKTNSNLSIIIVSFNTLELTRACIQSVIHAMDKRDVWEIIIVDNHSTDGSATVLSKEFPSSIILSLAENKGFAAANNLGIQRATGEHILLLNSDTEVSPKAIQLMLQYLDSHADLGGVTCKVLLPNGNMDMACHRGFPTPWAAFTYFIGLERIFPTSPLFSQYHLGDRDCTKTHEVDCISGAFFLTRRSVIDAVGVLDEAYFMYGEDIDWCYRMKYAGWKIVYHPVASILHKKKQSGRSHENSRLRQKTQEYFYTTMKLFYQKHYASVYPWVITASISWIIDVRIFLLHTLHI